MANSMTNAFKDATRKKQEAEFERATAEFARKLGPVGPDELKVFHGEESNPRLQTFNQVAKAAARRKIN